MFPDWCGTRAADGTDRPPHGRNTAPSASPSLGLLSSSVAMETGKADK